MKKIAMMFFVLFAVLIFSTAASADQQRENPSLYSFAEIVQKLPKMWIANPNEVMEMMKSYPDYTCWRRYDIIGCQSVNNRYCSEIHVNFQFSSEEDDAEFTHAVFTMLINDSEDVQKVIEAFWLDGMKAARIWGAKYPEDQVTLYFNTEETMMTISVPWSKNGGVWMISVDLGLIRG